MTAHTCNDGVCLKIEIHEIDEIHEIHKMYEIHCLKSKSMKSTQMRPWLNIEIHEIH